MRSDIPTGAKPWIGWTLAVLTLLLVLAGWVIVRGMGAGEALGQAERTASSLQRAIATNDSTRTQLFSERLSDQTHTAQSLTSDPVWRVAEFVPFVGSGMRELREISEASAELASEAVPHLVQASANFPLSSLGLNAGTIDITDYAGAQVHLGRAASAAATVSAKLADISPGSGPFAEDAAAARTVLVHQAGRIQAIDTATSLILPMLVVEEPRTYLLITAAGEQIDADPATLTHFTASHGRLIYESTTAAAALPALSERQPSFAAYAQHAATAWETAHEIPVDGVAAIDFTTLSHLLKIVSQVTTSDGDYTADNIVQRLNAGPQAEEPEEGEGAEADAIDSVVALENFYIRAVYAVLTAALESSDGTTLVSELADAADAGHVLLWSAHSSEQSVIADTVLADY